MDNTALRKELSSFYLNTLDPAARSFREDCWREMDERISDRISAYRQKAMAYGIVAEKCAPVFFENTEFCFEFAAIPIVNKVWSCGTWCYGRNKEKYGRVEPMLAEANRQATSLPLYTFCGMYGDELYHFAPHFPAVFDWGLSGVAQRLENALGEAENEQEKDFLSGALAGMHALKAMREKQAKECEHRAREAKTQRERGKYLCMASRCRRIPWEKPETVLEGLETVAFLQKAGMMLEGGGFASFGRLDVLLQPLYEADRARGVEETEIYEKICEFLVIWDAHMSHDDSTGGSEYNDRGFCYTLGGCDEAGNVVYNDMTRLFLKADSETKVIYPKIKCRFGKNTPKAYFDAINAQLASGRTTILYENDETLIPALVRKGIGLSDARGYNLLGCWEPVIPGCTNEHCAYVNLPKYLELAVYGDYDRPDAPVRIPTLDNAASFEEVYDIVFGAIRDAMVLRCQAAMAGRRFWHEIDPHMVLSAFTPGCIESRRDLTDGGTVYKLDELICAGFPNLVDGLLAVKTLCFDQKSHTVSQLLTAVRRNWAGGEAIRREILAGPFFGDGKQESAALAKRLNDDLFRLSEKLPTLWGGRVTIGYMLFMEMPRWAKTMRATPEGRHDFDPFERGLTPSRLHKIDSFTTTVSAMSAVDAAEIAANSVVNVTVPLADATMEDWEAMLRAVAASNIQSLQLNCVTRQELLDAQKHPEQHQNIVVRVCGYSARFTALSKATQDEILSRNFYEG